MKTPDEIADEIIIAWDEIDIVNLHTRIAAAIAAARNETVDDLSEAHDALDAALGMVERGGPENIPNWDWLRQVRMRLAARIAALRTEEKIDD